MLLATAIQIATQPTPEPNRLDTFVLTSIMALLVCGLLSVVREMREETAARP
ncbi:MAG: hypothetical protein Q8R82_05730 [Hyphomonadaceae bacterium]|nr:hypothetical protein [Hyphomonadaceae bacterium]